MTRSHTHSTVHRRSTPWRRLATVVALAIGAVPGVGSAIADTEIRIVEEPAEAAGSLDIAEVLAGDPSFVIEETPQAEPDANVEAAAAQESVGSAEDSAPAGAEPVAEAGPIQGGPFDGDSLQVVPLGAPVEQEEVAPARETVDPRRYRPINEVTANAALPPGLLPEQAPLEDGDLVEQAAPQFYDLRLAGGWAGIDYRWSATRFCHGPLYFEEINLERYGYGCRPCVQPFVSGAHFFLTVPTLPYQMTVHPPRECIYTLGHYRPGNRVPYRWSRLPWDARAAAVEASLAVGLVFLIP